MRLYVLGRFLTDDVSFKKDPIPLWRTLSPTLGDGSTPPTTHPHQAKKPRAEKDHCTSHLLQFTLRIFHTQLTVKLTISRNDIFYTRGKRGERRNSNINTTDYTMSIAEFYIENGIDPTDPNHMDDYFGRFRDRHDDYGGDNYDGDGYGGDDYEGDGYGGDDYYDDDSSGDGGGGIFHFPSDLAMMATRDARSLTAVSHWPLNESELDYQAETRGWTKLDTTNNSSSTTAAAPMVSYKRDDVRLNFWLSTGTVGSYLDHPRQGKTQLFRRDINMSQTSDLFHNPRQHTGVGYHERREHTTTNQPCRYGVHCRRSDCRFDHSRGGGGGGGGGGRGACRYGSRCTRPGCWFDHPPK